MKLILTLCLLAFNLFSANILSFKVYDRSDRTDILLTFDTPYKGRISQQDTLTKTTLLLYDAYYTQEIKKNIQSSFIESFSIIPEKNRTAFELTLGNNSQFKVSRTVDNYGLRLRFSKKTAVGNMPTSASSTPAQNMLPTKNEPLTNSRYIIVVMILFLAVMLLFFIKRKVEKGKTTGGWLFKNQSQAEQFNILFQKPIDNVNKVVLLEVNDKQYLVVLGSSHLLLDTFADKKNINEDGFESILQENQQELDQYMQINNRDAKYDPLQAYKEKASLEAYRSHM